MIEYTEFEIRSDGKREIHLVLPCFKGEFTEDCREFFNAMRMNRFYTAAAEKLYEYAISFSDEDVRRMVFLCCPSVETSEAEITVTLEVSLRRMYYRGSCPTLRKTIVHHWSDGILMRPARKHT